MAGKFKAPGVFIEEISTFPPHVSPVATAVPAFIGYTEKATKDELSVINTPILISSMLDYETSFGKDFKAKFSILDPRPNETRLAITIEGNDKVIDYAENNKAFLYHSLKLFFANGGGRCYIVSVGIYENQSSVLIDEDALSQGLSLLEPIRRITLIIISDAINLIADECYSLYQKVLKQCGDLQNRFAIVDIHNGFLDRNGVGVTSDVITNFRNHIGLENLSYGAAYYPWLHTSLMSNNDLTFEQIDMELTELAELLPEATTNSLIHDYLESTNTSEDNERLLHLELLLISPTYVSILDGIHKLLNLLPPCGAVAGIYARVDSNRGVWKAPANVGLNAVISPSVQISHGDQEDLNIDAISGKSINAIRTFPGKGVLIWGARTLDGNSNEWRYISVMRTTIMIKESIRLAIQNLTFKPNTSTTWDSAKNLIEKYLDALWRSGALAGSRSEDAFGVRVGLGETMTNTDILNGKMIIQIFVSFMRPAEFTILNFEQVMMEA